MGQVNFLPYDFNLRENLLADLSFFVSEKESVSPCGVGGYSKIFCVKSPVLSLGTSSLLKMISVCCSLSICALALPTFPGGHSSLILSQSLTVSGSDFNLCENLLADLLFFVSEKKSV